MNGARDVLSALDRRIGRGPHDLRQGPQESEPADEWKCIWAGRGRVARRQNRAGGGLRALKADEHVHAPVSLRRSGSRNIGQVADFFGACPPTLEPRRKEDA